MIWSLTVLPSHNQLLFYLRISLFNKSNQLYNGSWFIITSIFFFIIAYQVFPEDGNWCFVLCFSSLFIWNIFLKTKMAFPEKEKEGGIKYIALWLFFPFHRVITLSSPALPSPPPSAFPLFLLCFTLRFALVTTADPEHLSHLHRFIPYLIDSFFR